jgi:TonB-linked SusC/RagA family outer membrane protein
MNRILFILLVFTIIWCKNNTVLAQNEIVTGKVTSVADNSPIPGVNVTLKGSTTGTSTDADGTYSIKAGSNATLVFSFIGMTTQEVVVGSRTAVDVKLSPDVRSLSEVVVVGYGTQQRKDLTGSIASVTSKDIQNVPVVSFEQAIQGRAAGVQIETSSGKVGAAIKVRVRGSASVSAGNQPLYVVDGFPITQGSQTDATNEATNPLADINPNDIASIEVLKDASAAAIYGSRASNGVILITTKRGQTGKTTFNVNVSSGTNKPVDMLEFLNRDQYIQIITDAVKNINETTGNEDKVVGDFYDNWENELAYNANTNWQKAAYHTGRFQQYDLSASGGNEKTKFYIGGGYNSQEGITIRNKFERLSGRINLDHQATDRLAFGGGFNMAYTMNNRVDENNSFTSATQANSLAPVTPFIDPATNTYNRNTFYANPFLQIANSSDKAGILRNLSNVYASYRFIPSLVFRSELGLDLLNQVEDSYQGRNTLNGSPSGQGSYRTGRVINYTTNNTLTFSKTLADVHRLEVLAGMSYQQSNSTFSQVQGQGFPSDDFKTLTSSPKITFGTSFNTAFSYLSYFSRAEYKLADKYLVSLSGRIDGSSRFGEDNRYGFFPAGSVGWVISEEPFLKESKSLNMLSFAKIRSSIGLTGNSEIGNFAARGLYDPLFFGSTPGVGPTSVANSDLKWETTLQWDAGVDFGLFNDRVTGTFDYYIKKTRDLLLDTPVPNTTGFNNYFKNVGSMENKGVEFSFTTQNLVGKFKWSTSFNIAHNKNKITNLNESDILPGGNRDINAAIVGQPIGVFYGKKYAGVDPANGDALYYLENGEKTNDYTQASSQVLGSPVPKHFGGLTNNFSFAGFDLSVLLQYVYGNKIFRASGVYQSANFSSGYGLDNQTVDQMNYWKKPGDITNVPRPLIIGSFTDEDTGITYSAGESTSSRWLYDGSYLRFKTVTLGYSVPKALLNRVKLSSVRVYVTGQNLFTVTDYYGNDPEQNYTTPNSTNQTANIRNGYDWYGTPQVRTLLFGINIGF